MGNKTCRILLADDHDVVRRGMRALLEGRPEFEVCGEARTGREAVQKSQELHPDIILMDVVMPEMNGLDATRQIRTVEPHAKVVIVSQHESEELVLQSAKAGAQGYVLKSSPNASLIQAVEAMCQGQPYFPPLTPREPFVDRSGPSLPAENPTRHPLTARERQITQLLAEGKTCKEVAQELRISPKTVETHRANVMRKLDLRSVSDLVRYAIRNKITHL
jgi:DNA-binding NarL/FixJ family response regulator